MFHAMQAGARRIHPARKDPLHLALQGDFVDLDKALQGEPADFMRLTFSRPVTGEETLAIIAERG